MPINKPWQLWTVGDEKRLPGNLGVYEIGDESGAILHVGYAGARTRFGLREAITAHFAAEAPTPTGAVRYRYEVNQMYRTRWIELRRAAGMSAKEWG